MAKEEEVYVEVAGSAKKISKAFEDLGKSAETATSKVDGLNEKMSNLTNIFSSFQNNFSNLKVELNTKDVTEKVKGVTTAIKELKDNAKNIDLNVKGGKEVVDLNLPEPKEVIDLDLTRPPKEGAKAFLNFKNTVTGVLNDTSKKIGTISNAAKSITKALGSVFAFLKPLSGNILGRMKKDIDGMGANFKKATRRVLQYITALFGVRTYYTILRNAANAWLTSTDAGARQLNANLGYMQYALGSVLAPLITKIAGLIESLMVSVQKVIFMFTGFNIFSKASAKNLASGAKSAKEIKKQLGDFDELHTLDFGNDSSGGGGGSVTPDIDFSELDDAISPLAEKLYNFFKPLYESWQKYGPALVEQFKKTAKQIGGLISSVWKSIENIIVDGTVYETLKLILAIIGDIAEALNNAWKRNNNGDKIIKNLADTFNNLLRAIDNVVKSEGFQNFLNFMLEKIAKISEKLAQVNWQPFLDAMAKLGEELGKIALNILEKLVDVFIWFIEHPNVAVAIIKIAIAIKLMSIVNNVLKGLQEFVYLFKVLGGIRLLGLFSSVGLVIGAVVLLTGTIETLTQAMAKLRGKDVEIKTPFQNIKDTFKMLTGDMKNLDSSTQKAMDNMAKSIAGLSDNASSSLKLVQDANKKTSSSFMEMRIMNQKTLDNSLKDLDTFTLFVDKDFSEIQEITDEYAEYNDKIFGNDISKILDDSAGDWQDYMKDVTFDIDTLQNNIGTDMNGITRSVDSTENNINVKTISIASHFENMKNKTNTYLDDMDRKIGVVTGSMIENIKKMTNEYATGTKGKLEATFSTKVQTRATGGFVNKGQLFIANEKGPEWVSTMSGQTAVANNDQITQGIRQATYDAMTAALSQYEGGDTRVYLDTKEIATRVEKVRRSNANMYGIAY